MDQADPTFSDDVRSRLEAGVTPEISAARRRRFVALEGCAAAVLLLDLGVRLGGGEPFSSPRVFVPAAALLLLVVFSVGRYRRLAPAPGPPVTPEAVAVAAASSRRCSRCRTIVLAGEDECPACGALRHGGRALAFGILFGVGLFLLALWNAGLFDR